ncbi:MAG: metallophosphoesterase [Gammaproteobacteria bacterium]|nr:metallophosphoesterase [Gammaproteobacteria bacterium]
MVKWYDPRQLAGTALDVLVSTLFGRHADHRLMEALACGTDDVYDYSTDEQQRPRTEIWIDYVADTGDGWNSTHAVAYHCVQRRLVLEAPDGSRHDTRRGDLLIFGGDEVYPTPGRRQYEQRLVHPYATACRYTEPPHPRVFAVPGNHDWYDSLVSFTRLFCSKQWFGGWQAPQQRSYFALKLPHGWWLLGTDVQLGSDVDQPQVEYFRRAAGEMQAGDRIILCNAEPHWIYAHIYGKCDTDYSENNLAFLEDKVLGRKVSVFIAGDLHHYRRHEAQGPEGARQKITAGGGGAFLHPTHGPDVSRLAGGFNLKASFPDPKVSRRLCWRNLLFPFLNPSFGLVPAVFYVLTAWAVMADVGWFGLHAILPALHSTLRSALADPVAAFWGVATFTGFLLFTDTHSKPYRYIAGTLHGLIHLVAIFFLGWGATYLGVSVLGLEFKSISQMLLAGGLIFAGGWIAGSFIMGIYLLVSLNLYKQHCNEAFSSLAIQDWKSFLRLKIDAQGALTIFPVGIRRVPRRWKQTSPRAPGPEQMPDDPAAVTPALIEPPIVLTRQAQEPGVLSQKFTE